MRDQNPDVILVSMAGAGQTGPWRRAVTFADTLAAMSGLTHETARDGQPPQGLTFGLGDMVAANAATLAALELLHRGLGGHVDLSQLEAMAAHLGPAVIDGEPGTTQQPAVLPGVFRTRGDDRWIAIGPAPEADVRAALADVTPRPKAEELGAAVAHHDADTLAAHLQARGIPAYPVRDGRDLVERDPQLAARGFYVELDHPLAGPVAHEGVVAHLADTPGGLWGPAPLLGQHTEQLLVELLGLTSSEVSSLQQSGVLS